ncbi:MAG: hypothetical protein A2202_01370 [Bdellovibrionales bacterium RIFOXYA1_FULL_36_14]|nr:MAG: hypothetical protein A2202_01370 [Bdellovibrionales bacterium RIFOXYA1_FULL_36_14]
MNTTTNEVTPKPTDAKLNATKDENDNKYLLFSIGKEIFGVPLMGVREVTEPQKVKPIANTSKHFLGVINIRGEIIGVIDLRIRLSHPAEKTPFMAMIIFETAVGPMAALVDKVESVSIIEEKNIDRNPNISSDFPQKYLMGIGKLNDDLITLINLNDVLGIETLNNFRTTKMG